MKRKIKQAPSRYGSIISIRVTDDELEMITGLRSDNHKRTSDIMKEALSLYVAQNAGRYGIRRHLGS